MKVTVPDTAWEVLDARGDDHCICPVVCHPDRAMHRRWCVGSTRLGWRARVPLFMRAEVSAILAGQSTSTSTYRALVVARCYEARFGPLDLSATTIPATPHHP